jgi:hypothetical protein
VGSCELSESVQRRSRRYRDRVDIYKMDADGKAIEHWDTLQLVGDPKNSAPWLAPNVPRAKPNGMF